mmetsp:Transcript_11059/g.31289  ORF Transcript_11059/g.31289 Transcript_11059/m.31289 type:complete len:293 (-) Transcript_11059:505-1383(-)
MEPIRSSIAKSYVARVPPRIELPRAVRLQPIPAELLKVLFAPRPVAFAGARTRIHLLPARPTRIDRSRSWLILQLGQFHVPDTSHNLPIAGAPISKYPLSSALKRSAPSSSRSLHLQPIAIALVSSVTWPQCCAMFAVWMRSSVHLHGSVGCPREAPCSRVGFKLDRKFVPTLRTPVYDPEECRQTMDVTRRPLLMLGILAAATSASGATAGPAIAFPSLFAPAAQTAAAPAQVQALAALMDGQEAMSSALQIEGTTGGNRLRLRPANPCCTDPALLMPGTVCQGTVDPCKA